MLTREEIVEVFQRRSKLPIDEKEDRLGQNVWNEDQESAHEVGHREPLLSHQLQFTLRKTKTNK